MTSESRSESVSWRKVIGVVLVGLVLTGGVFGVSNFVSNAEDDMINSLEYDLGELGDLQYTVLANPLPASIEISERNMFYNELFGSYSMFDEGESLEMSVSGSDKVVSNRNVPLIVEQEYEYFNSSVNYRLEHNTVQAVDGSFTRVSYNNILVDGDDVYLSGLDVDSNVTGESFFGGVNVRLDPELREKTVVSGSVSDPVIIRVETQNDEGEWRTMLGSEFVSNGGRVESVSFREGDVRNVLTVELVPGEYDVYVYDIEMSTHD